MAIKKNDMDASLYKLCDELRGGMDPSQYKDYVLTLVFVKYVSDKFKGRKYAPIVLPEGCSFDDFKNFRNQQDIGEKIDIALATLAGANPKLSGMFKDVHFNDDAKIGKGEEMVKKLSKLINIFCRPEFDFRKNKASGDDILGDVYENLMKRFAVASGKSKGQFYTPAEPSRAIAGILGISDIAPRDEGWSVYDAACGSGSLLIRCANDAGCRVNIYGQEENQTTAGLCNMNMVIHGHATADIRIGNTFSDPQFLHTEDGEQVLDKFDFAVLNPPFSLKNWTSGYKDFGRSEGYGAMPPEKNGDYAWVMHILKSLKREGRAAIILPLGVLSRGNAEATIRKTLIDKRLIEGIVSFPPNIFFGTGIAACVMVISKAETETRKGIFMIDASRGFVKDGNKNRLRERDIEKIISTYRARRKEAHYSRFVEWDEIMNVNDCNLSMSRYIDSGVREDVQDVQAHLKGGIPSEDVEALDTYWTALPGMRQALFKDIDKYTDAKRFIAAPAAVLMERFSSLKLFDPFDVYEVLLKYWTDSMNDDVYLIVDSGWEVGRETEKFYKETENKKTGKIKTTEVGWDGMLIPRTLLDARYFPKESEAVTAAEAALEAAKAEFDEYLESVTEDDDEAEVFARKETLESAKKSAAKKLKDANAKLEALEKGKYPTLTIDEIKELVVGDKWLATVWRGIDELFCSIAVALTERVSTLAERYGRSLLEIEAEASSAEKSFSAILAKIGYMD